MTPQDIIQQLEHTFGRQPQAYMIRLMNDGLIEMSGKKKDYTVSSTCALEQYKRSTFI